MPSLLLVMSGGAIGSALRYLVGRAALAAFGPAFPWGTLAVNLIGGCGMGVVAGLLMRHAITEPLRLLLAVGVMGGFTTFSAFSLETMTMLQRGDVAAASLYVAGSVAGALLALYLGLTAARVLA
ncbi:MAG TPA: fluoride efflux transporter CrcB [Sphingomonas sp.]|jgi:CrcB protein|uniref:fluoride efflux transporter CrcB n=1 Tax=Sphingomonas sp. TaxID=28214 RepID=UPI002ED9154D